LNIFLTLLISPYKCKISSFIIKSKGVDSIKSAV